MKKFLTPFCWLRIRIKCWIVWFVCSVVWIAFVFQLTNHKEKKRVNQGWKQPRNAYGWQEKKKKESFYKCWNCRNHLTTQNMEVVQNKLFHPYLNNNLFSLWYPCRTISLCFGSVYQLESTPETQDKSDSHTAGESIQSWIIFCRRVQMFVHPMDCKSG